MKKCVVCGKQLKENQKYTCSKKCQKMEDCRQEAQQDTLIGEAEAEAKDKWEWEREQAEAKQAEYESGGYEEK